MKTLSEKMNSLDSLQCKYLWWLGSLRLKKSLIMLKLKKSA
jgi:hypothetical protein